ncbi:MAG: acyl carrier protein [Verrucomicrobiales bacterium]|nr:acyl carrier protein [Verrucomicrobiales bacterium]
MTNIETTVLELMEGAVSGLKIDPEKDRDKTFKEVGIDSLDKMMILLAIQEHWDCEFAPEEIDKLDSFGELCTMVEGLPEGNEPKS